MSNEKTMDEGKYGCLDMAEEGGYWVARFTLEGGKQLIIGSVHASLIEDDPALQKAFEKVMCDCVVGKLAELTGDDVDPDSVTVQQVPVH